MIRLKSARSVTVVFCEDECGDHVAGSCVSFPGCDDDKRQAMLMLLG